MLHDEVGGAFGDDDPVDVVEIGEAALEMGSFTPVKVLGCLSMIDDGELDWKARLETAREPPPATQDGAGEQSACRLPGSRRDATRATPGTTGRYRPRGRYRPH